MGENTIDANASRGRAFVAELAEAVHRKLGVLWRTGNIDRRLDQVPFGDELTGGPDVDHRAPMLPHAGRERGGGQPDCHRLGMLVDERLRRLVLAMRFIPHDQRRPAGKDAASERLH